MEVVKHQIFNCVLVLSVLQVEVYHIIVVYLLQVWNVHGGTCEWIFDHNHVAVLCCDFSPDGTKLITGDVEGSVKVQSLF